VKYVVAAVLVVAAVAIFLTSPIFQPPPAKEVLAGVSVVLGGFRLTDRGDDKHGVHVDLAVASSRDVDACLAFTLDEPFAGRRMKATDSSVDCIRPTAGTATIGLDFDELTDIDLMSTSHVVVWGVRGGRCNLLLQATGVCVVEQAGTVAVEFPPAPGLPSFPPFGSLPPILLQPFSFDPP
jgi:hypothetical protein